MKDLVEHPFAVHFESKNGVRGRAELPLADPHQHWQKVLKAAMVDPDTHFEVGPLREGVVLVYGARLQYLDGKRAAELGIRNRNARLSDPHIIAELQVAGF